MLEAAQYEDNTFATLTYSDESLPHDGSVSTREIQLFIKRLRDRYPVKFRYFAVGEYGEETGRPHYHLALFGFKSCLYGVTRKRATCCVSCELVSKSWGQGHILLGELTKDAAQYIAGYTTKKWTSPNCSHLKGRKPEFARMSLRPGIGLGMMHDLASVLMTHKLDERMIDVPTTLQHGTQKWPLNRYLRRKLREFIGRSPNAPAETLAEQAETLRPLREIAFASSSPLKTEVLKNSLGKRTQIHNREKIWKKRHTL